jgi:hypothetical protein
MTYTSVGENSYCVECIEYSSPKNIFHFCLILLFYVTTHSHCLQRISHPWSPKIKSNNSFVLLYFNVTTKMIEHTMWSVPTLPTTPPPVFKFTQCY